MAAIVLAGMLLGAPIAAQETGTIVLHGAHLIDSNHPEARDGMTLVIADGRVASVHRDGADEIPDGPGVERIDVGGATVIPGLIDAHVHLSMGSNADGWRERTEHVLAEMLAGGVTAVRDMAGDVRATRSLAEAVADGEIAGPHIEYTAIVAGPGFFDDPRVLASSTGYEPGEAPWARMITEESDIEAVVAEAAATGAGAIKAYALVDPDLLRRVAKAAHERGMLVLAHATVFPTRPSEAAAAGVDVLSHAAYLVWEGAEPTLEYTRRGQGPFTRVPPESPVIERLLRTLPEHGVMLDATVALMDRISGRDDVGELRAAWTYEIVRRAIRADMDILVGTDFPGAPGGPPAVHEEMAVLVEKAGVTPMQAIQAATRNNAWGLGIFESHGQLVPGKLANLIILDADPLEDIRNTTRIRAVMKNGVFVNE